MPTSDKGKLPSEYLWRALFIVGLCYIAWFYVINPRALNLETDLKGISPSLSSDPAISHTIDAIGEYGATRIITLLQAKDQNTLSNATASYIKLLSHYSEIQIITDDLMQTTLVNTFSPYRFNLLTSKQRDLLLRKSIVQITKKEQQKLYRLGADYRLLPFEEDPLAWFSEYLMESIDQLKSESTSSGDVTHPIATISILITKSLKGMHDQQILLRKLQEAEDKIQHQYNVDITKSGIIFFAADAAVKSKSDIQFIAITSGIAILALMIAVFRSLLPLAVAMCSIGIGVLFATAITLTLFNKLHILTIVFGSSLIGIVIDYSLHYFFHHFSEDNQSKKSRQSLSNAMLLSMVTSFIGFGALAFSDVDTLKKVAVFSCAGLLMAWLTVMSLGSFFGNKKTLRENLFLVRLTQFLNSIFSRKPTLIFRIAGLMSALGMAYLILFGIDGNDDPRFFFKPSTELLKQEQTVSAHSANYETNQFIIVSGSTISNLYATLNSLYEIADHNQVELFSIQDWLPSPSEQTEAYQLQNILYDTEGVIPKLLSALGIPPSKAYPAIQHYKDGFGQILTAPKLQNSLPWLPPFWSEFDNNFYANVLIKKGTNIDLFDEWSRSNNNVKLVNVTGYAQIALREQRRSATVLLCLSYLAVASIMLLYYRKMASLIYLALPASATIFTLIILPLLGQSITIFHMMALFLVLGLGMDYIVFAKEMKEHDTITEQAILLSAITSLLSFGLLSFSSMPVVQAFGSTVLVGNTINLIATIVLFNLNRTIKDSI